MQRGEGGLSGWVSAGASSRKGRGASGSEQMRQLGKQTGLSFPEYRMLEGRNVHLGWSKSVPPALLWPLDGCLWATCLASPSLFA